MLSPLMNLSNPMKNLLKKFGDPRGFSMMDVIIGLVVFSVISAAIGQLLFIQMRASAKIKFYGEGYALAREGAELIQALLDTNRLRFPGNPEACWDTLDATNASACVLSTRLTNASYIIDRNTTQADEWGTIIMTKSPSATDTLLYEHTMNGTTLINHIATAGIATAFRRTVTIEKSTTFQLHDTLVATSTVTWELFGQTQSATFSMTFYNSLL